MKIRLSLFSVLLLGTLAISQRTRLPNNNNNNNNNNNRFLGIIPGLSTGDSNTDNFINGGLLGAGLTAGAGALAGALFGGGGSSSSQCSCQCQAGLTFSYNGHRYGDCRTPDSSGQYWCYTTGYQNSCGDLRDSTRFPNNPWSYTACRVQAQCNTGRDCKGRPSGDKYYGCGCSNGRRKRQNNRFIDFRCTEASLFGRSAPPK